MRALADALADAGGMAAPRERGAQLRKLLDGELRRGREELGEKRSGYDDPLVTAVAPSDQAVVAVLPVAVGLRADPDAAPERGWLMTAALVGALVEAVGGGELRAGSFDDHLALRIVGDPSSAELVPLAFEDQVRPVDRLRAGAVAVPAYLLEQAADWRDPIGPAHPLRIAARVARLGGPPAGAASLAEHEDAVLALLEASAPAVTRPHEDPDPAKRVARRILQRLNGMGKWGGYHTEFSHLARGFAGNDKKLADDVGERLLQAGLLVEKPSVGQRHVFLNPRRAKEIHALIERGDGPPDLKLP